MAPRLPLFSALLCVCLLATTTTALFCGRDNCYQLLDVPRNASKNEIRRSYRRISSEKHPDKNPGDEQAAEQFRKISAAYEALLDDAKRAKYDDYLDNPTKYLDFLMSISSEAYAPKSNVLVVITGIIGIATLVHWLNINHTYRQTLRRIKESRSFQQQVVRLIKSKQAASKEQAESLIELDIVGLTEPQYSDLLVFKLVELPKFLFNNLKWQLNWLVSYKIRKLEYSTEDKLYLIQSNMQLSPEEWLNTSDKEKDIYLKEELWQPEKCDQFLRMKRIQLNRLGKGKKKKKSTPSPYSEAEPVNMSE